MKKCTNCETTHKNNNTGCDNTGDGNSGYGNSGDWNSGDWNSGDWNSGDWNTGDRNTGYWNTGNRNSGSFNTNEPKMRLFNEELDMTVSEFYNKYNIYADIPLNRWIDKDDMTAEEKKEIKSWETMGGYLKTLDFKEACKVWWKENPDDHDRFLTLPNFSWEIFASITGIEPEKENLIKIGDKKVSEETIKQALKEYFE